MVGVIVVVVVVVAYLPSADAGMPEPAPALFPVQSFWTEVPRARDRHLLNRSRHIQTAPVNP